MKEELQSTLVEEIRIAHDAAKHLVLSAAERGREAILKTREVGQKLKTAKGTIGDGAWGKWFANHSSFFGGFTIRTAQKWMTLADTPLEELERAISLRQAYIIAGIIPESHRSEQNKRIEGGSCPWLTAIQRTRDIVQKLNIGEMGLVDRENLKAQLKPLADKYAELEGAR